MKLPAKSYMVIFASGKSVSDPDAAFLHTNFKLNSQADAVILSNISGGVEDRVEFGAIPQNHSLGRKPEDETDWAEFENPTPGFPNTQAGYEQFSATMKIENSPVIITEAMASNKTTLMDNQSQFSDWIELYNRGDETINLSGFGLSDDTEEPLAWRFGDVSIEPGEYLLVFASGG